MLSWLAYRLFRYLLERQPQSGTVLRGDRKRRASGIQSDHLCDLTSHTVKYFDTRIASRRILTYDKAVASVNFLPVEAP
jgi:hypothetical protein